MEGSTSPDRTMAIYTGIALVVSALGIAAFMSSETFIASQAAMFNAMAVMAEVCRL